MSGKMKLWDQPNDLAVCDYDLILHGEIAHPFHEVHGELSCNVVGNDDASPRADRVLDSGKEDICHIDVSVLWYVN